MKTMGIFFAGILIIALFASCDEFENMLDEFNVTVNTDYYEVELSIPPSPAGMEVSFREIVQNDIQQTLQNQGYGKATVKSMKVLEASIEVMNDSNVPNLNAIESIVGKISTENLPEDTLISCINNTPNATMLPLESENPDVSSYMQEQEYILTIYGVLKEATTDTLDIKGMVRYQIELNVQTNL